MPEGKRSLGRLGCKWKDNIKMDCREIAWGGMDWLHWNLVRNQWLALVNMVMNLWVP
jgi:hypothetical protein